MAQAILPTSHTPAEWLRLGVAAISNAFALADDARLLAERQRWSCATALIVTAVEEGGKGCAAVLQALGVLTEAKGEKSLIALLRKDHKRKQALGAALVAAASALSQDSSWKSSDQSLGEMREGARGLLYFGSLLRDLVEPGSGLESSKYKAPCVAGAFQAIAGALVSEHRFESIREQALYVDFSVSDGSVTGPESVGESEYKLVAQWFQECERILQVFHGFWPHEAVLTELRAMIAEHRDHT